MKKAAIHLRVLNRSVSLLLVAAFLYNIFGYFVVFQLNRMKARSEMRQQLSEAKKKVTELAIFDVEKEPSFRRIQSNEFLYKGQMFDVRSEVKNGRVTTFYCYRDVKEELLMAALRKTAKSKESQQLVQHLITMAVPVVAGKELAESPRCIFFPPLDLPLPDRPHVPNPLPPEAC